MQIRHELPTLGEMRLVLQSFVLAVITASAVGTFAVMQGADVWSTRLSVYAVGLLVLIPVFGIPYWRHMQERARRKRQYEAESLAKLSEQQDEEIWIKMLVSGAIEADLRKDRKDVQVMQQDTRSMVRRTMNYRKSPERAKLLLELRELDQKADRVLEQIERLLGELKTSRQLRAAEIDMAALDVSDREMLLRQAGTVRGTLLGLQDFIGAFLKTSKDFAKQ